MNKKDKKESVNIEMFPAILSLPVSHTESKEKHTGLIKESGNHRLISGSPLLKRKFVGNSMTSFGKKNSSKLSTADLLYVKTFRRLPRLWPSHSNKQTVKIARQYKSSKDTEYYNKSTEVCRVSYPCYNGCSTCAFTSCFGPVKVFYSQFKEPKECFVREIRDGQGRNVIPKSRRKEFRGLVYDKQTHSLYPPLPRGHNSAHLQTNSYRKIFY
jgi:hypothetical protein